MILHPAVKRTNSLISPVLPLATLDRHLLVGAVAMQ